MSVETIKASFQSDPTAQGHICYLNNSLFDLTVKKGVYGFPGAKGIDLKKIGVSGWRAISSLYNIGSSDLIFFYRTAGEAAGAQEFHGVFGLQDEGKPPLIFHPNDTNYILPLQRDEGNQTLPFRFVFRNLLANPVSIVNDIGSKSGKKNNSFDVIQAMSEIDPSKPRLWGFRHPAVMNIGAAQKKSIVAISHKHALFLLDLLTKGKERPTATNVAKTLDYDLSYLPAGCVSLDDKYLGKHFMPYTYRCKSAVDYEAEIYAFIIHALKNHRSVFHQPVVDQLAKINANLPRSFEDISQNVILEMVPTPHIQETIDILLCDKEEEHFLILEIKNESVQPQDVEQTEKYVALIKRQFPSSKSVTGNVIGAKAWSSLPASDSVKVVDYEIENYGNSMAGLNFKSLPCHQANIGSFLK